MAADLRDLVTVSRMKAQNKLSAERIASPVARIAVGNFGTRPVLKKSTTTPYPRMTEAAANKTETMVKNSNGRSPRSRLKIIKTIRNPSRYVRSLLADPSGRDL